jgi:hypothetical protein
MANHLGTAFPGEQPLPQYAAQQLTQYGAQYGAVLPSSKRVRRHAPLNLGAIVVCIFIPWLLFCFMFGVMSFSLHYQSRLLTYFFVLLGLLIAIVLVKMAVDHTKSSDPNSSPTWSIFLAAASCLAWFLGVAGGDYNFFCNTEPFYNSINLNTYPSVDPSKMPGQRVMDAGQITFVKGSKLNVTMAMAFHNLETYCVAPIVNGKAPHASYDFWAVGLNCCTGAPGDFTCDEYNNPEVRSGLRVMREDYAAFFRLAVKQAESAYTIKAKHPVFLHWMQDPSAELAASADEALKYFLLGVFAFFAFLFFLALIVAVASH